MISPVFHLINITEDGDSETVQYLTRNRDNKLQQRIKYPIPYFILPPLWFYNHIHSDFHGVSNAKIVVNLGTKYQGINYSRFTMQCTRKKNIFLPKNVHIQGLYTSSVSDRVLFNIVLLKHVRVSSSVIKSHRSQCILVYVNYRRCTALLPLRVGNTEQSRSRWLSVPQGKNKQGICTTSGSVQDADLLNPTTAVTLMCCPGVVSLMWIHCCLVITQDTKPRRNVFVHLDQCWKFSSAKKKRPLGKFTN